MTPSSRLTSGWNVCVEAMTAGAALGVGSVTTPAACCLAASSASERTSRRVYPFASFSRTFLFRVSRADPRLMPRLLPLSLPGVPVEPHRHSKLARPPPRSSTQPFQNLLLPSVVHPVLAPVRSVKLSVTLSTMLAMLFKLPFVYRGLACCDAGGTTRLVPDLSPRCGL